MPLSKAEDLRSLNDDELRDEIVAVKKQLFDLRFQKATRQLEGHHQFKHTRHRLAQLMTIERERELEAAASEQLSSSEPSPELSESESGIPVGE
jgi:large subunit ribosomal protein L29